MAEQSKANTSSEISSVGGAVPTSPPNVTECCGVPDIGRYCAKCGYECRLVEGAAPTSTPLDALLAEMDKILSATPNPTTEPFTAGFNVATYQWAEHLRIIMAASPASALITGEKR
jgi:hypothetical protein